MQVSHQKDHVTHAVIGGMQTIDFGISNSAEFFNILSSTLYKDQKLAVVRETLCNAWDAHIEAGITDKPVELTLTPEKFIIRDFGTGIHLDDMGVIYGTYGNSTKKNDGKQTGGFGLGCKAPFAYIDHFEVQSNHDGVRTIYNLSKSSAQAMGKPGIVPIASFPTKETGLQVSIDLVSPGDFHRFKELIKRIVRNGDMNMTLNGEPLKTLGFDTKKANYLLTTDGELVAGNYHIMVRYGNVIYPIEKSAEIGFQYDRIISHLDRLKLDYKEYHIVFQAPPHSISVQPSREGLSMQEHTIATLKGLMDGFLTSLKTEFMDECNKVAKQVVKQAVADVRIRQLLNPEAALPFKIAKQAPSQIQDLAVMARRYMESNYPNTLDFRKKDIAHRVRSMIDGGLIQRGLGQTYIRALEDVATNSHHAHERTSWLHRNVIGPIVTKMIPAGLDRKRLYVIDPSDQYAPRRAGVLPAVPVDECSPKHLFCCLPYLRNIVVLAQAKTNLWDRARRHKTFEEMGHTPGVLFYYVGTKKTDKENARAFFKNSGMEVVDLIDPQDWEVSAPSSRYAVAAPRKPPKVGVQALSCVLDKHGSVDIRYLLKDEAKRTTAPEFIYNVSTRADAMHGHLGRYGSTASLAIVKLFGDKGAITNNSTIFQKWRAKGVENGDDYVIAKVTEYIKNNPRIHEYWAFHHERVIQTLVYDYHAPKELVEVIYKSPVLRNQFKLVNNLTDDDKLYLRIWKDMTKNGKIHSLPDESKLVYKTLDAIQLDPANKDLMNKFNTTPLVRLINKDQLRIILAEHDAKSPHVATIIEILGLILK